MTNKDKT